MTLLIIHVLEKLHKNNKDALHGEPHLQLTWSCIKLIVILRSKDKMWTCFSEFLNQWFIEDRRIMAAVHLHGYNRESIPLIVSRVACMCKCFRA
jgi:hypothetical protein